MQCVREFDSLEGLKLDELRNHGLRGTVQGAIKVGDELRRHLYEMVLQQNTIDRFSDSNMKYVSAMADRDVSSDEDEKTASTLPDSVLLQIARKKERISVATKTVTTVKG